MNKENIENGGEKIMNNGSKIYLSLVVFVLVLPMIPMITSNPGWTSVPVYGGGAIMSVAVDPVSPNIIYAAADLSGPYKSTDFGNGWMSIRAGLKTEADWDVSAIAINPNNHNQIYLGAGVSYGTPSGNYGGLFRSDDGGNTWNLISRQLKFSGHGDVRQSGDGLILFDKNNNSIMYGATIWDGIFKSTDGGNNWKPTGGLSGLYLTGMAMNNNGIIFASAGARGSSSGGIYKSQDGGNTWITLSTLSTKKLVVNGDTIYAALPGVGIYESTNGGNSWTTKNNGISSASISSLTGLIIDQTNPNILYTVASFYFGGLYKTTDGGNSWISIGSQAFINNLWYKGTIFSAGSYSLTIDPTNSNRIYLTDSYTVWASNDSGTSWYTNAQGLETTVPAVIRAHPSIPGLVIVGTNDVTGIISNDGGISTRSLYDWRPGFISDSDVWGVDYIDNETNRLTATIYVSTGKQSDGSGKLWKSTDGGTTFNALSALPSSGAKKAVAVDPNNPNIIYVSAKYDAMYKSIDSGNSWTHLTNGLPSSSDIKKIVINPNNTNILYALDTSNGVYKSTNGGSSWSQSINGFDQSLLGQGNSFNCLAIDPNNVNVLYAGGQYYGLYKSVDSAGTWHVTFPNPLSCGDVLVSKINSAVYVGGYAEWFFNSKTGLYVSKDGANNWSSIGDMVNNTPLPFIKSIEEDPYSPGSLYIGTEGGGTYRYGFLGAYPNTVIVPINAPIIGNKSSRHRYWYKD